MQQRIQPTKLTWRGVKTWERASELIDQGVILPWKDTKSMLNQLKKPEQIKLVQHLAQRLAERCEDRLSAEIIVETLLCVIAQVRDEALLHAFFQELFIQGQAELACRNLVEIACTSEAIDLEHDDDLFAVAVVMICELGLSLEAYSKSEPGEFEGVAETLDHVATYLMSISNCNNHCVRLSLISYFGKVNHRDKERGFRLSKILHRFGQTVMDGLMQQLFQKKSESMAMQFLVENTPHWFIADVNVQRIIHDSFKLYMLKNLERFVLFLQQIGDRLLDDGLVDDSQARRVFAQHLAALFQIADDVGHMALGRDVLFCLMNLQDITVSMEILHRLRAHPGLRDNFREMVALAASGDRSVDAINQVAKSKNGKRGRKPSMNLGEGVGTMEQVAYLGSRLAKAS